MTAATTTRYTLHLPEQYNDGRPVGQAATDAVESWLLGRAGGFTLTHGIGGYRGDDGTVYREPVLLYAVDTDSTTFAADLHDLAGRLATLLDQEAVYVTSQPIAPSLVYGSRVTTEARP